MKTKKYNLKTYKLKIGSHSKREKGMCAMEFVAYLANEPHSDQPKCVSPLITSFIIKCNDNWTDKERELLKPYLKKVLNTRDGKDLDRAKIFAMHSVTKISPYAIELIGLKDQADKMRNANNLKEAYSAAYYASSAAYSAASSAAYSAADSAYYAASSAAYSARFANSANSANSAAYSAASSADSATKNKKIRKQIIKACLDLLKAVIDPKEKYE